MSAAKQSRALLRPRWIVGLTLGALALGCTVASDGSDADTGDDADLGSSQQKLTLQAALGTRPVLVVARQKDAATPLVGDAAFFRNRVFSSTQESVAGYYHAVSGGRFELKEAALYAVVDPQNDAAFEKRAQTNLTDGVLQKSRLRALQEAEDNGFDFSKYDTDKDGTVEPQELMVLSIDNASIDSAQTGWPPCSNHSGVRVCPGVSLAGHKSGIINFAHELAHQLGTLDLYGPECLSQNATLMWCTRDGGKMTDPFYYLDPWYRGKLGWVSESTTIGNNDGSATLFAESHLPHGASRIVLPRAGTTEKLILEARAADGYDSEVAHQGLMAWYVKEDASGNLAWIPTIADPNKNDPSVFELSPSACSGDPNNPDSRGRGGSFTGGSRYRFRWLDGVDTGWLITVNPTVDAGTTIQWQKTANFPSCPSGKPENFHILRNGLSNQCLEVDTTNGREVEHAHVRQETCGFGVDRQQWQTVGGHLLRNNGTGKCLDVDEGTGLTWQQVCDGGRAQQLWDFGADGSVKNRATGKCLDLDPHDGLNTPGIYVKQSACSTSTTQDWKLEAPPPALNITLPNIPILGGG